MKVTQSVVQILWINRKSENYKPLAAAANKKFGGKYLARGKVYNKKRELNREKCYN